MFLQLAVKHRATARKLSRREFYDFKQFYHLKETRILDLWPCGVTISAFVLIRLWAAHLRKATISLQHCPSLERLTNRFFFLSGLYSRSFSCNTPSRSSFKQSRTHGKFLFDVPPLLPSGPFVPRLHSAFSAPNPAPLHMHKATHNTFGEAVGTAAWIL